MRFSMGGGQGPSLGEYLEAYGLSNESGEPVERLSVEAGRTVASMMPARSAALVDLLRQIAAEHGGGGPLAVIAEPRSTLVLQSICREANPLLVAVRPSDLVPDAELEYVANVEASQLA